MITTYRRRLLLRGCCAAPNVHKDRNPYPAVHTDLVPHMHCLVHAAMHETVADENSGAVSIRRLDDRSRRFENHQHNPRLRPGVHSIALRIV